jgi:hypothetical protein
LREDRKLRVSENMVLRRIFGPRRDNVTGQERKLHNEELNDLYCSPNIVRVINIEKNVMGRACRAYGGRGEGLVGKPEGRRPLGRPRLRWEDNNNMDLQEVGRGSMDWIELAEVRDRWWALVNAVMNIRVP